MHQFNPFSFASQLHTKIIGHPLVYAPRLASTQLLAARLAERGWSEGLVVVAEEQRAGKGRLGRSWWAPFGQALLLSVLLQPVLPASRSPQLTMLAGLAAAEAIETVCAAPVSLKWPNDLYMRGRKIGGILTEGQLSTAGNLLQQAIVGIGINVAVEFVGQPELQTTATSLHIETARPVEREALLLALLSHLERRYRQLLAGHSCHTEWADRLLWLGEAVRIVIPGRVIAGVACGVDESGALLVRQEDGWIETIWAGDVSLTKDMRSSAS